MRTIFNFLGPLTNPAGANRQLLGVADRHYQETIAEALVGLGSVRALVVAAEDGLDELSLSAPTRVIEVADGGTAEWFVEPGQFGLAAAELATSRGGPRRRTPPSCAPCWPASPARARDLALLNAAAAIYVGGLAADLEEGVAQGRRGDRFRRGSERAGAADRGTAAARPSRLCPSPVGMIEQLIAGARQGVEARRRELPQADLESRLSAAARIAPSTRRWCAPASR